MEPNRVSAHGDVEGLIIHETLPRHVGRENPEAVATPLELGAVRIEHPEGKRPDPPIEKQHDSVATRARPAVAYRGDPLGVEHPIIAGLEYEIVVSEAVCLEERRACGGRITLLWESHSGVQSSDSEVVSRPAQDRRNREGCRVGDLRATIEARIATGRARNRSG